MMWKVIQVKTGEEINIMEKLLSFGLGAVVPIENRLIRSGGDWTKKPYVIFTGYVFIDMDYNADNYYTVKGIPGVVQFLEGTLTYLEAEQIRLLSGYGAGMLEPSVVRQTEDGWEIVSGILKLLENYEIKIDKRSRKASFEMMLNGQKKKVSLSVQIEGDTEQDNKQEADEAQD